MGKSRRTTNNSSAGFTLIEIVISIAILAIISVPLMYYFTESLRYSMMMSRQQRATFLAQEITEGLLAEEVLVFGETVSDGDTEGYTVPFFDGMEPETMEIGADGELVVTAMKDGYRVEVTIDNPSDSDKIQDLLEYRIDAPVNVIYIDSTENTQAVFEFMGMYNTFYSGQTTDADGEGTDGGAMTEDTISTHMSREMRVELSSEGDNKTHVKMRYVYTCSAFHDENGHDVTWTSPVLVNKAVENLLNLYLIYDWCDGGDTITLSTVDNLYEWTNFELGLYVLCQPRSGEVLPKADYKVIVNKDPFEGKLFGYTNLNAGQLEGDFSSINTQVSSGDAKPAVAYIIHTRVYLKDDLLADITAMKGE